MTLQQQIDDWTARAIRAWTKPKSLEELVEEKLGKLTPLQLRMLNLVELEVEAQLLGEVAKD